MDETDESCFPKCGPQTIIITVGVRAAGDFRETRKVHVVLNAIFRHGKPSCPVLNF